MDEIIKVKNSAYGRYEDLLIKRDNLRKEAHVLSGLYIKEFGDLILEVFQKKIECIRKKKTIAFAQQAINHGNSIDQETLQKFLEESMAEYKKQLDQMIRDNENSKNMGKITQAQLLEIRKIYLRIAKQIHPDINPKTSETPQLMDLWNRVVIAYNSNELDDIKEAEVLVQQLLEQLGFGKIEIEIPDINDKIAALEEEIKKIQETDPYQYKFILDDPDAVEARKAELKEELKSYTEYDEQLEKMLDEMMIGGSITWRMN